MMNPNENRMMRMARRGTVALSTVALLALGACSDSGGSSASDSTASSSTGGARPYQPQPIEPRWTLADITMDERVQFPEDRLPNSRAVAQAVADFASALVAGRTDRLSGMLMPQDQEVVKALLSDGAWDGEPMGLPAVRINVLEETGEGIQLGLGIKDDQGAYLTAWEGTGSGGAWTLTGMAIEPLFAQTLAELDGAPLTPPDMPQVTAVAVKAPPPVEEEKEPPSNSQASGGLAKDNF